MVMRIQLIGQRYRTTTRYLIRCHAIGLNSGLHPLKFWAFIGGRPCLRQRTKAFAFKESLVLAKFNDLKTRDMESASELLKQAAPALYHIKPSCLILSNSLCTNLCFPLNILPFYSFRICKKEPQTGRPSYKLFRITFDKKGTNPLRSKSTTNP